MDSLLIKGDNNTHSQVNNTEEDGLLDMCEQTNAIQLAMAVSTLLILCSKNVLQ